MFATVVVGNINHITGLRTKTMRRRKIDRAWHISKINPTPSQQDHIEKAIFTHVDHDVLESMTAKQIAQLFIIHNISWHDAKAHAGAEYLKGDDCVWIGRDVQKLISVSALKEIA